MVIILKKLTNLAYLDCSKNKITVLKPIYRLDKLEELYTDIKIKSIEEERTKQILLRRYEILKIFIKQNYKNF